MRIFLTGATGFLGSYLVADLIAAGHEVGILLRPGADSWRLAECLSDLTVIEGDFDGLDEIEAPLRDYKPEAVAHLGWRGVGNTDRNSPVQARNILDTVDLASMCVSCGVKVLVGAGSQAEYGPYPRTIRENDTPNPTTLYGRAKLAAGGMAGQLCAEHGVRFAWLRIFSTYGPKDAPGWLIPSMIKTLREGRRMQLTACEQRWSFLHARDAAAAFRLALTRSDAAGLFNLGNPEAPPLRDTIMTLRNLVNPGADLGFGDIPYRPDQVMILQPNVDRLEALGWQPKVALEAGLSETVSWHDTFQRT